MRGKVIGFGIYVRIEEGKLTDSLHELKIEAWTKAFQYFDEEAPKAKSALETELRAIIGSIPSGRVRP